MIVEIRGAAFKNKGAELMLRSIVSRLRQDASGFDLRINYRRGTPVQRRALGLGEVVWLDDERAPWIRSLHNAIAPRAIDMFPWTGRVSPARVDAVLDASGFAYGDPWGPGRALRAAGYYRLIRSHGGRVILLPQQLGPFDRPEVRDAFARMAEHCDAIFARDRLSYGEAAAILGESSRLRVAPDFTILTPGVFPEGREALRGTACLVPNTQMILKTDAETARAYRAFLDQSVAFLQERRIPFFALIHDVSGRDAALVEDLRRASGATFEVVAESDPVRIKGLIGACAFTIGSRFHGLVSALSQGVPSVGAGWSHKYDMLFEEYDCADFLVRPGEAPSRIEETLARVADPGTRDGRAARLREAASRQQTAVHAMWDAVEEILS